MPKRTQEKQEMAVADPLKSANGCVKCRSFSVASFPVHLVEKDGNICIVCQVVRCAKCGFVKRYGSILGVYKPTEKGCDTNIERWPEILRNNIDPEKFDYAIDNAPMGKIWLEAKNLQRPFISRERAPFYEAGSRYE